MVEEADTSIYRLNMSTGSPYNRARNGGMSRLEVFRDMAEDIMTKSQDFLHLAGRAHPPDPYTVDFNFETRWTSQRARLISVVMYVLTVSFGAIILATYYMLGWHPNTDKLFGTKNGTVW